MNGVPLVLDGGSLEVLVIGGGSVAARKARTLLDGGARVRVVAPRIGPDMQALVQRGVSVQARAWKPDDIGDALLVIAATDERDVNAAVAREAKHRTRLVNVVDAPHEGNCVTPATHRQGDLLVAVCAGGVPTAAARIRDAIAAQLDAPFGEAVRELGSLRERLLGAGDHAAWARARSELIGAQFCEDVAAGGFSSRVAGWR